MKITVLATAMAATLAFGAAAPALADEHSEKTEETVTEKLTIEDSIEDLMANEDTAAVLKKHIPDLDQHPAYGQFKAMSLIDLQPFSAGQISDELIEAIKADLEALA